MYKSFQNCLQSLDGVQSIDFFLAKKITLLMKKQHDDLLFHSIMATSQALRNGHSCLKLDKESEMLYWHDPDNNKCGYQFPTLIEWQKNLAENSLAPADNHPLIYEHSRLYLRRYWQFEEELGDMIQQLIQHINPVDRLQGRTLLTQLFPGQDQKGLDQQEIDWQKIAVANALGRHFSIIAGGPGTGKTFTVTKLLAALQALSDNSLRIAMVAPTGKAAQRLNESIQKAKSVLQKHQLSSKDTLLSIPDVASTVHRLLGVRQGSHNFRYNKQRKLPYDVVLVDEISMIDLPLMTRLFQAIEPHCQIIMLGDPDQLPSVAAGSVLADLVPRQVLGYSNENSQYLSDLTGFKVPVSEQACDYLTVLQKSHRFDDGGEIGQLASRVIKGEARQSWNYLQQGQLQIKAIQSDSFTDWLEQMVEQYYVPLFTQNLEHNTNSSNISQAFVLLNQFRVLAATRSGEHGIIRINETIEQSLRNRGLITSPNELYPGRPIMVIENHYNVGLYNGDTGLLWLNEEGNLQAVFPQNKQTTKISNGELFRWLSLGRLPTVETVYAMTIHKTQGSEFSHVALVLPQRESPILTRELLYTGITRASSQLSIWSEKLMWELAVKGKVQRYSGLRLRVFRD